MNITLYRKWKKDTYTIGQLYVDGKFFCNTVEDKDRVFPDMPDMDLANRTEMEKL